MLWCGWSGIPKLPKGTKLQNPGKKEVRPNFNFWHEDKNQNMLEADTIVFGGHNQAYPKYPKRQVFAIFLQYFKKEGKHEVDFCMQINTPFYKLELSILASTASLAQGTQNNKFAKFLQYLEKEVRNKNDFCTDKHQSIQNIGTIISNGCVQACLKYSK